MCWFSRTDVLFMVILFHGKKRRHIRHLLATARPRISAPHFVTIEDVSLLEKTKSRDENKIAATEQGNFYWERRLCLFWILSIEPITMLLVSLVHQFIWSTFTLVFTRTGIFKYSQKPWMRLKLTMASIFIMSDRAAFRGTFRVEVNQTSKVELYACKIASWTVESFKLWNIFVQSSIFDAWLRSH